MRVKLIALSTLLITGCGSSNLLLTPTNPALSTRLNPAQKTVHANWVLRNPSPFIPGELVVEMKDNFRTQATLPAIAMKSRKSFRVENNQFDLIRLKNPQDTPRVMKDLQAQPQVKSVALHARYTPLDTVDTPPNAPPADPAQPPPAPPQPVPPIFTVPNGPLSDSFFALQWSLPKIGTLEAWKYTTGSPDLLVAVIDSGIDYRHPDLQGKIINGIDFMPNNAMVDDGSPDSQDEDPMDELGHGTHVAGIIAAIPNNRQGIAGIAPNVKILNIKALNGQGWGSAFSIAQAITYAVDKGAKIINMSLGGKDASKPIELAVQYAHKKGVLIIAAAGNEYTHTGFPAAFPGVFAVGATDENDRLASFSNHDERINVLAPGVDIMSTTPTFLTDTMTTNGIDAHYSALSGTSMATPMVTAQAALLMSKEPSLTAFRAKQLMQDSTKTLGDPRIFGHGRINIPESLRQLSGPATNAPPIAPPATVQANNFLRR